MGRAARWVVRAGLTAAACLSVVTWLVLPAPTISVPEAGWRPTLPDVPVRGVYHVHTRRSDGTGTVEDVAAAAGRAGLDFVVLTDHGDATRTPDPPRMVGSVLVIDAAEISTSGGHVAALGLAEATPYRLAGNPRDVADDISRFGGVGIVTHPDSPKRSLAWKDWSAPVRGLEWLNADSEWRDETRWAWAKAVLSYPWRPVPAVVALFDRPEPTLARWDEAMKSGRYLVTLAGADAHARLGVQDYEDDGADAPALELPAYESIFRAFSTTVLLDEPLKGQPDADAARLLRAIAYGRTFTVLDGIASPGQFEFFARTGTGLETMGESVRDGEPVVFVARTAAPAGTRVRLLRNGVTVAESSGLDLEYSTTPRLTGDEQGIGYRVEVIVPGAPGTPPVPWIVSNPVFVTRARGEVAATSDGAPIVSGGIPPGPVSEPSVGFDLRACTVEKDSTSTAELSVPETGDRLRWTWRLAGGAGQAWVAVSCAVPPMPGAGSEVVFHAAADLPTRLSVQLREPTGNAVVQRWQRTVRLEPGVQQYRLPVASFLPVEKNGPADVSPLARNVLFVVDRTHGTPGMRRTVQIERAGWGEAPAATQVRTVNSR